MKKLFSIAVPILAALLLVAAVPVLAQQGGQDALNLLQKTGLGGTESPEAAGGRLPILIGSIIRAFLGLLGIIFVLLFLYAGWLWMTARGETEPIEKAKSTLKNAVIGLIITILAYAITGFVVSAVIRAGGGAATP